MTKDAEHGKRGRTSMRSDPYHYLGLLRRWTWLPILTTALAAILAYVSVRDVPQAYMASTTVMVGDAVRNPGVRTGDLQMAQQLASAYVQIAQRQPILEATIKTLGLNMSWVQLRQQLVVVQTPGSMTFEIRVVDVEPSRASALAATIAQQLIMTSPTAVKQRELEGRREFVQRQLNALQARIDQVGPEIQQATASLARETSARGVIDRQDEIRGLEQKVDSWRTQYASLLTSLSDQGGPTVLSVIEPVAVGPAGSSLTRLWTIGLAALGGLFLGAGAVFVIDLLDGTLRRRAELERLLDAPTLGVISRFPRRISRRGPLPILYEPDSSIAESYRGLAASVRATLLVEGASIVVVSSAEEGAGKSTVAANLACALAQAGRRVALLDLDLRSPSLHTLFNVPNDRGVSTVAAPSPSPIDESLVQTLVPDLVLLPSGPSLASPLAAVLTFLERELPTVKALADVIIIDTPPLLAVADGAVAASCGAGCLFVARAGVSRRAGCAAAREALERAGAKILGTVLNGVPSREATHSGYRYPAQRQQGLLSRLVQRRAVPHRA